MPTDMVQCREYSCPCSDCATGKTCQVASQTSNPWKNCPLILKPVVPIVNPVLPIVNPEPDSEDERDDNPWDYWEP